MYLLSLTWFAPISSCKGKNAGKIGSIAHPIKNPPEYTSIYQCDNCRMNRNGFARTRHEFNSSEGIFYVCSIHCVAVLSIKLNTTPFDIKVAEYLHPERMIDARDAFYLIGSKARGTMTKISKIGFASKGEAERFAVRHEGRISSFEDAFIMAKKEVKKSINIQE